jgi:outer membrane protein TolC
MRKWFVWYCLFVFCLLVGRAPMSAAQEAGALPAGLPSPAAGGLELDWSRVTVLDLETAVGIAMAGYPGVEAAVARVRQAKAQVDQARSFYWPRLDATASGARIALSDNAVDQGLANPLIDDPETYYNADLTASWILFDGFERKFSGVSARYGEQSSAAALSDIRRLLISSVALAYYSAQLASENIAIARADEAFNQRQLTDAQARQRVGTGALSDVLNFQVRMNQAKTQRINQEYRYQIALYGLAALMGLPESRLPAHVRLADLASETDAELATPPLTELLATAMDFRPDIQALRWRIKQSEALIKVAQSGYYPSIVVAGSLDGERTGDPGFETDDFGNRVQMGLTYNLFEGGFTRAKVRESRQRKVELEKQLDELTLSATADIRSSAALVLSAQTQVALQHENLDLVKRTRDLVEKEYNAGQGSLVRLNEAQRDVTTAQSNLALALVALRQAWVELETRTGKILATHGMSAMQSGAFAD